MSKRNKKKIEVRVEPNLKKFQFVARNGRKTTVIEAKNLAQATIIYNNQI